MDTDAHPELYERVLLAARILAAFQAANCFLLLHPAQFAFRNEPAFASDCGKHTTFDDLFTEPLEKLILRFIRSQHDNCQRTHLPPCSGMCPLPGEKIGRISRMQPKGVLMKALCLFPLAFGDTTSRLLESGQLKIKKYRWCSSHRKYYTSQTLKGQTRRLRVLKKWFFTNSCDGTYSDRISSPFPARNSMPHPFISPPLQHGFCLDLTACAGEGMT